MESIEVSASKSIAHIVFDRPERKNSLTSAIYLALGEAVDEAARRADIKVLLFSGASGVFTAGNDLDDFIEHPPLTADAPVFRFLRKLAVFPKPIVAAVEGFAVGIGTTMLLHCDLVYAAENAKFALPFVGLGLVPEAGASLLLPRLIGHQRAAEKLLLCEQFPAAEALAMGLVNRVLTVEETLPFAMRQAERLALLPTGSVRQTKELMKAAAGTTLKQDDMTVLRQMDMEIAHFAERIVGPAAKEAIAAFKEKRKPDFSEID